MTTEEAAANRPTIVDVHTHIAPATIPARRSDDARWPGMVAVDDRSATLVIGDKPFRTLDARSWDVAARLGDMGREGIGMQVLSPMPELLSFWLTAGDTAYLASHVNEHIAAMIAVAPDSFAGLGMIPAQDVAQAVDQLGEIERLGLRGIEIGTHINGVPLGDASLWPIYAAAEARNLAIFVHPLHPCGLERMGGVPEVAMVASFPFEIAMAAVSLISAGVPQRFPGLRLLLSHGGGALASILGRLEHGRAVVPPVRAALPLDVCSLAQRFWFDSNVYDAATLRFVVEQFGFGRMVMGSDYPYVLQQERPADFVEASLPGLAHRCGCNARAFLNLSD